jgi:hypothetical protein
MREFYLQKRKSAINNGQGSMDDELFDESLFMDETPEAPPPDQ